MDSMKLIQARHSVRKYTTQPIDAEKRTVLDEMIADINRKNGLHIQIIYDEPKCFDTMLAHYGAFSNVSNYISLVGPKGKNLEETTGYYGEQLVLNAQELGLRTCWVALTHGKSRAKIDAGEKETCLIAIGYGETDGVSRKSKTLEKLSNLTASSPMWFKQGVEAAALAPTAVNQQKFYLELQTNDRVKATCGMGFYSKIDFGIVKLHFELASGKDSFVWM